MLVGPQWAQGGTIGVVQELVSILCPALLPSRHRFRSSQAHHPSTSMIVMKKQNMMTMTRTTTTTIDMIISILVGFFFPHFPAPILRNPQVRLSAESTLRFVGGSHGGGEALACSCTRFCFSWPGSQGCEGRINSRIGRPPGPTSAEAAAASSR